MTTFSPRVKLFVISVSTGKNQFTDSVSVFILVALLLTAILQASSSHGHLSSLRVECLTNRAIVTAPHHSAMLSFPNRSTA